jgi:hypothetical protein
MRASSKKRRHREYCNLYARLSLLLELSRLLGRTPLRHILALIPAYILVSNEMRGTWGNHECRVSTRHYPIEIRVLLDHLYWCKISIIYFTLVRFEEIYGGTVKTVNRVGN